MPLFALLCAWPVVRMNILKPPSVKPILSVQSRSFGGALLRPARSLGLLGQVGDIVVAAETGGELLARGADLAVSEPAVGGFRA